MCTGVGRRNCIRLTAVGDDGLLWLHPLRLKTIKKDIVKQEMAIAEKDRKRLEAEKEAPYQTRRLGKHTYGGGGAGCNNNIHTRSRLDT